MKDFYKILGVDKRATFIEIKKRFRAKALLTHPDKSKQNTKDDFIELYEAYEILTDKKKRERYDKIYEWIETPINEQNNDELEKDLILIHEKALSYANNFSKFDKEIIAHIVLELFFSTDQLLLASLVTIVVGLWTIGKGLINLQLDYSFIGLILATIGAWLAKLKLDRIRENASRW